MIKATLLTILAVLLIAAGCGDRDSQAKNLNQTDDVRAKENLSNDRATKSTAIADRKLLKEQVRGKKRLVTENSWYQLWEVRVDEDTSYFPCEVLRTDAQLGIGMAIDIARVADGRGFQYFLEAHSDSRGTRMEFFYERPETDSFAFDVKLLMTLAHINDEQKAAAKKSKVSSSDQ